ncbi:MAG TPA: hypothetical protein VNT79_14165 [Phycisphaerae bacterium]|nr:hypothetical protein [Phycisphaerae bacterium]
MKRAIDERLKFAEKTYALDAGKMEQLRAWAATQWPAQVAYMDKYGVTLRRREMALSAMIAHIRDATDDVRDQVAKRMQDQIFEIHAAAPLSHANVARHAETLLNADEVKNAHETLAKSNPQWAASSDIGKIDFYLVRPVEVGGRADPLAQTIRRPPPNAAPPPNSQSLEPKKSPDGAASKSVPPPPPPPAVKSDAVPERLLETAPPVAKWEEYVKDRSSHYDFSDQQTASAQSILKSCADRAKAPPSSDDKHLDKLYDELKRRVTAVATIEQINRAAKNEPGSATPAPGATGDTPTTSPAG